MYRSGLATDGAAIHHNELMAPDWLAAALFQIEWTSPVLSAPAGAGSAGAALRHRFSAEPAVAGAAGARIRGMN